MMALLTILFFVLFAEAGRRRSSGPGSRPIRQPDRHDAGHHGPWHVLLQCQTDDREGSPWARPVKMRSCPSEWRHPEKTKPNGRCSWIFRCWRCSDSVTLHLSITVGFPGITHHGASAYGFSCFSFAVNRVWKGLNVVAWVSIAAVVHAYQRVSQFCCRFTGKKTRAPSAHV